MILHMEELKNDPILAFSDLICLNETWMENNTVDEALKIDGFELHLNSMGIGKGIITYFKVAKLHPRRDITKSKAQITFLSSPELDIVNVYRSQGMNNKELASDLKSFINKPKFILICGDFNLCYLENRNNEVTRMLEENGFTQLVHEATHFKGGHNDHVYSNHNKEHFQVEVNLYNP